MKIKIIVSVVQGSRRGNEITAERWKLLLEELGHWVEISNQHESILDADLLIAIHAVKCHSAIRQFKTSFPDRPVVVCLSGTDLHGVFDSAHESNDPSQKRIVATKSLELADRIILLEPMGQAKIPIRFHNKCVVVFQSAERMNKHAEKNNDKFVVSVLGHLHDVKDPMRTAIAARGLPANSRIAVVHVGKILEGHYQQLVEKEMRENHRYRWVGLVEHQKALQILVNSQLTVLSSIAEGAPSVISEAIVNEVPIVTTRIDASIGLLGDDYPGFFEVGNTEQLTELMMKLENSPTFLNELLEHLKDRKKWFTREGEKGALQDLVNGFKGND